MPYRIVLAKSAVKELDGLPPKIHDKIIDHLRQLEENPRIFGAEKLTAIDAYKLRVGIIGLFTKSTMRKKKSEF